MHKAWVTVGGTSNNTSVSVAALKLCQYFTRKFPEHFGSKDWIIQKICSIFYNFVKNCDFINFGKNVNIGEHSTGNFSTNFLWVRQIAQGGGKILLKISLKVLAKFYKYLVSSKFHKNCNTNSSVRLNSKLNTLTY